MKKEFVPHKQSLELKELEFNEPCFGVYIDNKLTIEDDWLYATNNNTFIESNNFSAPTFSQAFRFFREKYGLFIGIVHYGNGYSINDLRRFDTYEEAELACINKLIEIVKKQDNE
jgi:hypothetical protein